MRAVLDTNVIVSAALSPAGSPAKVFRLWVEGAFELICSPLLVAELKRVLAYPKLVKHINAEDGGELVDLVRNGALMFDDSEKPPVVSSPDPGDDYLVVLAAEARAVLVSGDDHLLSLSKEIPVYSPVEFLRILAEAF